MFKVIWSMFNDSYIVVPYNWGMVLPLFDGTAEECKNYIKTNLS